MNQLQASVRSFDEKTSRLEKRLKCRQDNMKKSKTQFEKSLDSMTNELEARDREVTKLYRKVKSSDDEKRELIKQFKTRESGGRICR